MKDRGGRVACLVLAVVAILGAFSRSEGLEPVRLTPDDLEWVGGPAGPSMARITGDVQTPGLYVVRYRFPANVKVPPHSHPDDRVLIVLSGTLYVGYGECFDEGALKALPAGSTWTEPAKQPHFVATKDGEVVLQVVGTGPSITMPVEAKQ